jgi:hypothetical protein
MKGIKKKTVLRIEGKVFTIWKWKGRYSKVEKFNRNCKVCNKGLIEDEVHFL